MLQWPEMCGNSPDPSTALSLGTQPLSIVPFAAAVCLCLQMCQLDLPPEFRNAVSWLCDGGFCLFAGEFFVVVVMVFFIVLFWGFGCVIFFIF